MKRKFYLEIVLGLVWILSGSEALGLQPLYAGQKDHKNARADFEHVHALAMDGAGKAIFLGTHVGLFRSDDSGHSWQKVALSTKYPHVDVMAVTPDPKDAKTIYVATHEAGVFKSTDAGTTWKEINTGLGGPDVHDLAIDPNDRKLHINPKKPTEMYLSTMDGTIYVSTDAGVKWKKQR